MGHQLTIGCMSKSFHPSAFVYDATLAAVKKGPSEPNSM